MNGVKEINEKCNRYENEIFDNLCSRFEEPDGRNRWDAPIFIVIKSDISFDSNQNKSSMEIVEAIIHKKPPAPNLSTVVKPMFETNYLHELDKVTGDILDTVIEAQKNARVGEIKVPKTTIPVILPSRNITLSEFRRIKRQFININKSHTMLQMDVAAASFAEYLTLNLT